MSENKYFRFHERGGNSGEHWISNNFYDQTKIDEIVDPCGNDSTKQITSVPSPFARIDLVLTAFKKVSRNVNQGGVGTVGSTIFHRMVSEALDVAQIFYQKSDRCRIIEWDRKESVADLIANGGGHKRLGESLKLFLDGTNSYNFNNPSHPFDKTFIVDLGDVLNQQIVGGTSPATLFFGSVIEAEEKINIFFSTHRAFDPNAFKQLHQRELGFVKWMLTLRANIKDFASLFSEVNAYINNCLKLLSDTDRKEVNNFVVSEHWNDVAYYEPLFSVEGNGSPVRILDFDLKKGVAQDVISDFQIVSDICSEKLLVLPSSKDSRKLIYNGAPWVEEYKAVLPRNDDGTIIPVKDRVLPYDGRPCPYLTIDDVFESHIVKTVFPINSEAFYDGNYKTVCTFDSIDKHGYLLPIKKEILRFLTPEQINRAVKISEQGVGDNVLYILVSIDIPIQKGAKITYQKTYTYPAENKFDNSNPKIDEKGQGQVVEYPFNILIYSKYLAEDAPNYIKMGVLTYKDCLNQSSIKLLTSGVDLDKKMIYSTQRSDSEGFRSYYYSIDKNNFDAIVLHFKSVSALLLPRFEYKSIINTINTYTFAIDFGTSNTHIEYISNADGRSNPLTHKDDLLTLHTPSEDTIRCAKRHGLKLLDILPKEFLPEELGELFKFPQRSVIAFDGANPMSYRTLCDFNIVFAYEKWTMLRETNIRTDIKWANYGGGNGEDEKINDCLVSAYLEQLVIMIRNKVIAEGGNLANTKIRWFYPVSMDQQRRDSLKVKWDKFYAQYFNSNRNARGNVVRITESVAPYFYYHCILGKGGGGRGAVTIDIGGGTTDLTIFGTTDGGHQVRIKNISSFRFAANSLFGDGYKKLGSQTNGFVTKYWGKLFSDIASIPKDDGDLNTLQATFNSMLGISSLADKVVHQDSNKIINYLFSIENKANSVSLSNKIFNDSDMKLVPLIFYSTIIYHTAKMMRISGYQIPDYILFSGTGSKIIDLIVTEPSGLNDYTRAVFARVFDISPEQESQIFIRLEKESESKELCCKGGLYGADEVAGENMDEKITILVNEKICKPAISDESTISDYCYSQLSDSALKNAVLKDVGDCISAISYVLNVRGFAKKLSVSAMWINKAQDILRERGLQFLNEGISAKDKERSLLVEDPKLEEPLFFYPLIGLVNELAFAIAEKTMSDQNGD